MTEEMMSGFLKHDDLVLVLWWAGKQISQNSPKYLNITRKKSPILSSPYPAPRLTWFLQPKHPKGQGDRLNMASTEGLRASWQSRQGFSAHRWDQYPGCEGRTCRAAPWISSSIDGVQMKRHQTKETWRACLMSTQGVGS